MSDNCPTVNSINAIDVVASASLISPKLSLEDRALLENTLEHDLSSVFRQEALQARLTTREAQVGGLSAAMVVVSERCDALDEPVVNLVKDPI